MLYYIITLIILIAILLYQYFTFIRIYYIGLSLHQLRELRCEVLLFLSGNVKQGLSIKEAAEYRQFLIHVDAIINHFDRFKTELKKFKSVKTIYSTLLFSSQKLASDTGSNTILYQYKGKVSECILTAFKAIPFCRVRLFLFLFRMLASILFSLGIDRYGKQLKIAETLYQLEKELLRKKGIPCNS
jgi:hypothetical protein